MPAWNRPQRAIFLLAAAIVAVLQLAYFDDNGVAGYGWIVSILVVTGFCVLAFSSAGQVPDFRLAWNDQRSKARVPSVPASVEQNLELIAGTVEHLNEEIRGRTLEVQTNRGPMSAVTASMIRSSLLMYGLGLLAVCKLRQDGDFLRSDEYRLTKAAIAKAAAEADNVILEEAAPDTLLSPDAYKDDLREVEEGIRAFFRALAACQLTAPADRLHRWLAARSGLSAVLGASMESLAKEETRRMYTALNGRDPGSSHPVGAT
jgi:hypothetical protein